MTTAPVRRKRRTQMSDTEDSKALAEQSRNGDKEAARKIVDLYLDRLLALARRYLSIRMARRIDPEDIVQSAFRTFFTGLKTGQFHIAEQDDLCKLLMRITVYKTLRQVGYHQAAKRDPSMEAGNTASDQDRVKDLLDRTPPPETAVAFVDQLEHFLSRLQPEERLIIELRLQGYTNDEIAQKMGSYDRKIRRIIERIRSVAEEEGLGP
jgi:RNA polymerase sigma-70 factor (ECF subfamily)